MLKENKDKICVRTVTKQDVTELIAIEEKVWPKESRASREMLLSRINTFPEGFLCVIKNNKIQGFVCSEIIYYKDTKKIGFNWYNLTDKGYIKRSHNPNGDSLYGISLSILPQYTMATAAKLLEGLGKLIIKKRLKRAIFGARIPLYHKYYKTMPAEKYIFTRRKNGTFLDPEIAFYQTLGIYPVRIIKDYFEDPESLNFGVLVTWKNPFYKITNVLPFMSVPLSKSLKAKIYSVSECYKIGKKPCSFCS